jgi:Uma2 family endonuclease
MPAPVAEQLLTIQEYDLLPLPLNGAKMELVAGKVVTYMTVNGEHGELASDVAFYLKPFARRYRIGRVFVETAFVTRHNPDHSRCPDVSWLSTDRDPGRAARSHGSLPIVPNLAVEVTSPSDNDGDVQDKVDEYLAAGVDRVWVIRPGSETITVFHSNGDAHLYRRPESLSSDDAGFPVEGFVLSLDDLFGTLD